MTHRPVLLQEVINGLNVKPGEIVLDLTINRGGHSLALCRAMGADGHLIGVDADEKALNEAKVNLQTCACPVDLVLGNFRNLAQLLESVNVNKVDVILGDLGLSSQQLGDPEKGFSFQINSPLTMTLDAKPNADSLTAYEIVNSWQEETLADIIYAYGQERFARKIAQAIVLARGNTPIKTTGELVSVIQNAIPARYQRGKRHFATKTFQALRIAVNDELGALETVLPLAWEKLNLNGRLAIITFHSLEARIVKNFFRQLVANQAGEILTKHAIKPSREESLTNPRSRSAQLRIIKKIS